MKYVICKQDEEGEGEGEDSIGVEIGWVYKVVENNGGDTIIVTEEIVGVGCFNVKSLKSNFCEITEKEYKLIAEDSTDSVSDKLDEWIERNWELKP